MNRFMAMLQFLTRIPVKTECGFDEEFHKGMYFFPAVGTVIGIIVYIAMAVSYNIFSGDAFIAALVAVMTETALTGGLHLDGLGDTADALFSYRTKDRMLEIMKDSRLGTNAMLAVLFLVLFKVGIIKIMIQLGLDAFVVVMPIVSRFTVLILTYRTESPRENGMGNAFIGKCTAGMIVSGVIYTLISGAVILFLLAVDVSVYMYVYFIAGTVITAVFVNILKKWVYSKIDGITGDILGCGIEMAELVFILSVCIIEMFL